MNKLQMAQEYALKMLENLNPMQIDKPTRDGIAYECFELAEAMLAENDKRVVKLPDVFFDAKPNEEWQPDWSQAPAWANYIAVYSDYCNASYFEKEPKIINGYTWGGTDGKSLLTPIPVYTGNWQGSLRKRP